MQNVRQPTDKQTNRKTEKGNSTMCAIPGLTRAGVVGEAGDREKDGRHRLLRNQGGRPLIGAAEPPNFLLSRSGGANGVWNGGLCDPQMPHQCQSVTSVGAVTSGSLVLSLPLFRWPTNLISPGAWARQGICATCSPSLESHKLRFT
jgi:hypothetical protein